MDAQDMAIKRALADAEKQGKLAVVAAVTGFSVLRLRQIMKPGVELSITEKYSLAAHMS